MFAEKLKKEVIDLHYVYILLLKNNKFYIGESQNVIKRYFSHLIGEGAKVTKGVGVKEIICYWRCEDRKKGRKFEKYLKSLTKAKKIDLIKNPELLGVKYGIKLNADDYEFVLVNEYEEKD